MTKAVEEHMARLAAQKEAALEKAKAADAQLRKLRAEQDRLARISARKERNKALIQAGLLVEMTSLLSLDRGTLLGGLLALVRSAEGNPEKTALWKQAGDAEITRRETEKAKKKTEPKEPALDGFSPAPLGAAPPTTTSRAIAP
ncbi:conjugal transfer protein TraD [Acidithiobacillus ferrivorans]|uniref:conjugal transfer protein TraD n=1 Tax=Acidithiobacillus ferrivorans TaxID=160808 RepID=UPI001CBD7B5B|nr:conjugal transfer protein TraD [Acidithiobacillus ferrivorans]